MFRIRQTVIASIFIIVGVSPVLAQDRELVGMTVATTDGSTGGISAMHAMCRAEFEGSRMCSSSDLMRNGISASAQLPSSSVAWINPSNSAPDTRFAARGTVDTVSGTVSTVGTLNCSGWAFSILVGLTIDDGGEFAIENCSVSLPVACCAPVKKL